MADKDILFKKVRCSAFLKKVHDGKFIQVCKGDVDEAVYCDTNNPDKEITSWCCGDLDFLKTYYEVKEKTFTGIVVGIKNIVVTGYLVADMDYSPCNGENLRIYKHPKQMYKCAIVYYANNRKRYVPLKNIEVGD